MFTLGRFTDGQAVSVAVVMESQAASLREFPGAPDVETIDELLSEWESNFARIAAAVDAGAASVRWTALENLRPLPPITRPPRVLNAAANYRAHVAGMQRNFTNNLPKIDDSKPLPALEPYLFAKVCPVTGAQDEIVLPAGMSRIDWEAELAVVIGKPGSNIPREKVADHIAGYMCGNDVSCRDKTWREDRPALRSDWLAGKSYDSFCPIGPLFVPKAFVPDHTKLRIRLWVNAALKQDGISGDMIFGIEDQISFASAMMRVLPGDIFHTGTPAGTGQERGEFLKAGDVVEMEIDFCGRQRNIVAAGSAAYVA
jgi:2-keto-4-pentenoate hydratase/2-oxohepta-3-ene-1,7-dioic acid hydratase in catechol pathway